MVLSMDLGYHRIKAVVMDGDTVIEKFIINTPSIADGKIEKMQETAGAVKEALLAHNVKVKQCYITLPSNVAVMKEIEIPKVVEKDMGNYVYTQFSSVMDLGEQDIVDYYLLEGGTQISLVLGFVIKKPFIEQCVALAKAAGLKCQKVDLHLNSLKKYLKKNVSQDEKSYIAVHMDNGTAEINLYEGEKLFIRTAKLDKQQEQETDSLLKNWAISFNDSLMSTPDHSSWTGPLAEQMQSIINFQLNRNRQKPVSEVYLYGDGDETMAEELSNRIHLPVQLLSDPEDLEYINAYGSQLKHICAHDVNLLAQIKKKSTKEKQSIRRYTIMAAVVLFVIIVEFTVGQIFNLRNKALNRKIDTIEAYLNDPATNASIARAYDVQRVLNEQMQYNAVLKQYNAKFDTILRFDSSYISGIYKQAEVYNIQIDYCDYSAGQWSITGYADNSTIAAEFSGALERENLASEITFKGYDKNQDLLRTNYKFQLTGTLEGGTSDAIN